MNRNSADSGIPLRVHLIGTWYYAWFYDTTLMHRAGIDLPGPEWTWDDLVRIATEAQPKLPKRVKAVALLGGMMEAFMPWVVGHGEPMFTPNGLGFSKATMIAWYRMWEGMRKAGVTQSAEAMAEVSRSVIENAPIALGRVMIDIKPPNQFDAHQAVLTKANGETLVMNTSPIGPAGPGEYAIGNGISIGTNCDDNSVAMATAFTNFFEQNDEAAQIFASDNGVVAVDRQQQAQLANPKTSAGAIAAIKLTQRIIAVQKPTLWPSYYGDVVSLLERNYQSVSFGQMTIEAAVDQFFDEAAKLTKR